MTDWIKCSERLPDDCKKVIVWVSRFGYYPDYIDCAHRQDGKWNAHEGNYQSITHWQPMPEAPTQ
ncbi:hypothetical protein FX985_03314 [Pseudomonas extremaustralis]|uniref:DUF551 domain-containing protein n=1 Tax=Pseudomonas extremaustralis TaxID=359110 RepID=A0A5M9J5Y2_9PSED|nr:DUF551 domain-containing protein [Pseudomonas extremaustralis]KAA8563246.1 hypothetical protein FX985_03314 [Pseudomonas extremaustralis]